LNRKFILSEIQRLNSYRAVNTIRIQYKNNLLMLCRQTISLCCGQVAEFSSVNPDDR